MKKLAYSSIISLLSIVPLSLSHANPLSIDGIDNIEIGMNATDAINHFKENNPGARKRTNTYGSSMAIYESQSGPNKQVGICQDEVVSLSYEGNGGLEVWGNKVNNAISRGYSNINSASSIYQGVAVHLVELSSPNKEGVSYNVYSTIPQNNNGRASIGLALVKNHSCMAR